MNQLITRRTALKLGGAATVGVLTLGVTSCGKDISLYTATVIGSLEELVPLLPGQATKLRQAIAVAKTFDVAYRDGKFASAASIFENLTTIISEIIAGVGVMSETVKLAVAVGGVALRAIAVLLRQQSTQPAVAAAVAASDSSAKAMIEQMANPKVIDAVVETVKP